MWQIICFVLVDVQNRDFRPRKDSELVDKARTILLGILTKSGRRSDLGAYEWGSINYWIPGYQTPQASKPIPADGAEIDYTERDLIWLGGYGAREYDVYWGTSKEAVEKATAKSTEFMINQPNNIFRPAGLKMNTTYFWRIDSIGKETVKGTVWQFKITKNPFVSRKK